MARALRLLDGEVDLDSGRVVRESHDGFSLTPLEVRLLRYLATHADRAVPAEELLVAVWGYRPGVKSRAVTFTVNRLRAKIELDRKQPRQLITVRGIGVQWMLAEAPPAGLVGRTEDLTTLQQRLRNERVLVLVGRAGVGKSALVEAAQSAWFTEVVRWELEAPCTEAELVYRLALLLGLDPAEFGDDLPQRVLQLLEDRSARLWLDGAERAPAAVRALASRPSTARLVITSRTVLADLPTQHLAPLSADHGSSLFRDKARVHVPEWDASPALLAAIVDELGGVPLAIELAAPSVRWFAPDELLDRLRRDLAVLSNEPNGWLDQAIRWATSLLSPEERQVFSRLSVFRGLVSLQDVEAVTAGEIGAPLDALRSLERKGLLEVRDTRVRLAIGVRAHAQAALKRSGAAPAAQEAHRRHVLDGTQSPAAVLEELLHLHQRDAASHPLDAQRALRLALPLLPSRLAVTEIRARIERVQTAVPVLDPSLHAYLGWCRWRLGEVEEAESVLLEAAHVAQKQQDVVALAQARSFHGALLQESGRSDEASAVFERAVHDLRPTRAFSALALALNALAISLTHREDFASAKEHLFEGLEATGEDAASQGLLRNTLGNVYLREGRLEDAARVYTRALSGPVSLEAPRAAVIQSNLASVRLAQGRFDEALDGYAAAADVHRRSGRRRSLGLTLASIGRVHLLKDELDDATEVFRTAVGMLERVGDRLRASWTRAFQVVALLDADQHDEAERALKILREHETATDRPIGAGLQALLAVHQALRDVRTGRGCSNEVRAALDRLTEADNPQLAPLLARAERLATVG